MLPCRIVSHPVICTFQHFKHCLLETEKLTFLASFRHTLRVDVVSISVQSEDRKQFMVYF